MNQKQSKQYNSTSISTTGIFNSSQITFWIFRSLSSTI